MAMLTARPVVCGSRWSLCLLWHHGKHSAAAGVSLPSREDMAQMAGTSNAREAAHMGRIQCVPRPPSAALGQDHPPPHQLERSSPVRNRMLELGTSGTVRGEDGNILTYSASCRRAGPIGERRQLQAVMARLRLRLSLRRFRRPRGVAAVRADWLRAKSHSECERLHIRVRLHQT
jgi:hypothetical protein